MTTTAVSIDLFTFTEHDEPDVEDARRYECSLRVLDSGGFGGIVVIDGYGPTPGDALNAATISAIVRRKG